MSIKSSETTPKKDILAASKYIDNETRLQLWVKAGGRCEFLGCNKYLLGDEFTDIELLNLADVAHIVARSKGGVRGEGLPIEERNKLENLMLLCSEHHNKVIDKKKLEIFFSVEKLKEYKKEHEKRIKYLTGLKPGHETAIIRMIGTIRDLKVEIPTEQIREAVLESANRYPRYPMGKDDIEIDLTNLSETSETYWQAGADVIRSIMEKFYKPSVEVHSLSHVSVFALARIPFLIFLGNFLSDKINTDLYQRHRNTDKEWIWKEDGKKVEFSSNTVQQKNNIQEAALILSVSGKIMLNDLPDEIKNNLTVYEISPIGAEPSVNILDKKETLFNFQEVYQNLLLSIRSKSNNSIKKLHIFPATPAPIAIACGMHLLRNVSPTLIIYDRLNDEYSRTLEVTKNGN